MQKLHETCARKITTFSGERALASPTRKCKGSLRIPHPHLQLEDRKSSMRSTLLQVKPPFLRAPNCEVWTRELTRETDMKVWVREAAEHQGTIMHSVTRRIMCNITRSITHSFTRSFKSQHGAQEKLTGEIVNAKLAHQNLHNLCLSRRAGMFTLCCSFGVFLCYFRATRRQVKPRSKLVGVSFRDNIVVGSPLGGSVTGAK